MWSAERKSDQTADLAHGFTFSSSSSSSISRSNSLYDYQPKQYPRMPHRSTSPGSKGTAVQPRGPSEQDSPAGVMPTCGGGVRQFQNYFTATKEAKRRNLPNGLSGWFVLSSTRNDQCDRLRCDTSRSWPFLRRKAMGRFHTRLGLLCLVRAAALSGGAYAAASMPLAGFFHSLGSSTRW